MVDIESEIKRIVLPVFLLLVGCSVVSTPVINQADLSSVDFGKLLDQKTNKSCSTLLLMFLPIEFQKGIAETAWEAEISKVSYVEHTRHWFVPFYIKQCTTVYGE